MYIVCVSSNPAEQFYLMHAFSIYCKRAFQSKTPQPFRDNNSLFATDKLETLHTYKHQKREADPYTVR